MPEFTNIEQRIITFLQAGDSDFRTFSAFLQGLGVDIEISFPEARIPGKPGFYLNDKPVKIVE